MAIRIKIPWLWSFKTHSQGSLVTKKRNFRFKTEEKRESFQILISIFFFFRLLEILVCVVPGKDSFALWRLLADKIICNSKGVWNQGTTIIQPFNKNLQKPVFFFFLEIFSTYWLMWRGYWIYFSEFPSRCQSHCERR